MGIKCPRSVTKGALAYEATPEPITPSFRSAAKALIKVRRQPTVVGLLRKRFFLKKARAVAGWPEARYSHLRARERSRRMEVMVIWDSVPEYEFIR